MSAAPVKRRPATAAPRPSRAARPSPRPQLAVVQAPSASRSLLPFAILCIGIVLASFAAVLIINTAMTAGASERRELRLELAALEEQRAELVTGMEFNSTPTSLAAAAERLGMVPAGTPGFIELSTGTIIEVGD